MICVSCHRIFEKSVKKSSQTLCDSCLQSLLKEVLGKRIERVLDKKEIKNPHLSARGVKTD